MREVIIYTDGACSNNPGEGGWGTILIYMGREKELSGYEVNTTNNRMELTAVIEGLKALKETCKVDIYSDSAYIVNAFKNDWISYWITHNWKTSSKSQVQNRELWEQLIELKNKHVVNFIKVKGHADNEYNNRCDKIARGEIEKNRKA